VDVNRVCPWPGTGLATRDPHKDAFNYFFSGGHRNVVERMFGQVYQRWGIPLRKVPVIIMACFRLHNFLKDFGEDDLETNSTTDSIGAMRSDERNRTQNQRSGFDNTVHSQHDVS
jgi:hypothetical protein